MTTPINAEEPQTPTNSVRDRVKSQFAGLHSNSCHSTQAWLPSMTEPFPCDCDIKERITALLSLITETKTKTYNKGVTDYAIAHKQTLEEMRKP